MILTKIQQLIHSDLTKVKQLIETSCSSSNPLIQEIIFHLFNTEGKMIRPILNILTARLCNYTGQEHIKLAAAIELFHTATLLHDDVIDNANLRRGTITTNYKWDNKHAVLAGDLLLAKASQTIIHLNDPEIFDLFTTNIGTIVEGEMLQLVNKNNINITEKTYLEIITAKTAKLFEATAKTAATLANCSQTIKNNMANYGLHFGIAFQLMNDVLDYQKLKQKTTSYKDIQDGNITLPVIYLLKNGTTIEKDLVKKIINTKNKTLLPTLQTAIANSNAIAYTIDLAKKEAILAKEAILEFADSAYKAAAIELMDFIIAGEK